MPVSSLVCMKQALTALAKAHAAVSNWRRLALGRKSGCDHRNWTISRQPRMKSPICSA
ncbi:MAG: hypothetical protein LBJ76_00530 [Candidatus Accumulibacter sp.]|nr:hypothetical protein [Accumulibacter sp.]